MIVPRLQGILKSVARGFAVFPCHSSLNGACSCGDPKCGSPAKHPLTRRGFKDAEKDPALVRTRFGIFPDANYAVATGEVSGVFVLDIDGIVGAESLAELERLHGDLPSTLAARTGRGRHLYFKHPGFPVSNSAGKLGPGLDVRGDGGYVLMPPSVHITGTHYAWCDESQQIADAPPWLLDLVRKPQMTAAQITPPAAKTEPADRRTSPYGEAALKNEATRVRTAATDTANDTLNKAAFACGQLLAGGEIATEEEIVKMLREAALARGQTPKEADATIASGLGDGRLAPRSAPDEEGPSSFGKPSQSTQLVKLAQEHYDFGRTPQDEPFAVPKKGSYVARMLRGAGSLRRELAARYMDKFERAPSSNSLADAIQVIEGLAFREPPQDVPLRVARHGGTLVIDLGNESGSAIVVEPGKWTVAERSPVLFRRTPITLALPHPVPGGDIADLFALANIAVDQRPLVVAWLVAALFADIPHAILALVAEQGGGKSCGAKLLVNLVDPTTVPLRSPSRDVDQWVVSASGSWVVCLDNLSHIPPWYSDALCRAVTGDGDIRRRLYSDGDIFTFSFRRVVVLTSIDPGVIRGDLGERLLRVEQAPIPDTARRPEAEIVAAFNAGHPRFLGALLDLAALALKELPKVTLTSVPRMADFARIVAALDAALGTHSLATYRGQSTGIAEDVLDGDPVAIAVRAVLAGVQEWSGSPTDLVRQLESLPGGVPRGCPGTAAALGGRLRRIAPALREGGIGVEAGRAPGGHRGRWIRLVKTPQDLLSLLSPPSLSPVVSGDGTGTAGLPMAPSVPSPSPMDRNGRDSTDGTVHPILPPATKLETGPTAEASATSGHATDCDCHQCLDTRGRAKDARPRTPPPAPDDEVKW